MKYLLQFFLVSIIILTSCGEDSPTETGCDEFLEVKSQEEIIIELGYKYREAYYTKYENGELVPETKYLYKTCYYRSDGQIDSTILYNEDRSLNHVSMDLYDDHDNYIGWKNKYQDGSESTTLIFEYFYNEKGLIERMNYLSPNSENVYESYTYSYNSSGLLIESKHYSYDDLTNIYKNFYNGCSMPFKTESYDETGSLIYTMYIEYDKFGNVIKYRQVLPDGSEQIFSGIFEYDSNGRRIKFNGPPNVSTYSYNSENLVEKFIQYDETGTIPRSIYEYDYFK